MSFILDALKKSESERHRHSGPVLMDVRIAPPRRRLPTWAWVIAGVLLVNLLLLVWLLWLAPDHRPAPVAPAAATSSPAQPATPPAATPQTAAPTAAATAPAIPQAAAPVAAPPPVTNSSQPATVIMAPNPPASAAAAARLPDPPIDTTNLPRVQDLIAAGAALPPLRLSLHVYDPVPANRYVLLNGVRVHEGEFTADGLKLLQITPGGAVLEWRGRRAFLGAGD